MPSTGSPGSTPEALFSQGQTEGAIVMMLSIDDRKDQNRVQVDSPWGQSALDTIERAIALLAEVWTALQMKTTVA